jgi:hypothetical protein
MVYFRFCSFRRKSMKDMAIPLFASHMRAGATPFVAVLHRNSRRPPPLLRAAKLVRSAQT